MLFKAVWCSLNLTIFLFFFLHLQPLTAVCPIPVNMAVAVRRRKEALFVPVLPATGGHFATVGTRNAQYTFFYFKPYGGIFQEYLNSRSIILELIIPPYKIKPSFDNFLSFQNREGTMSSKPMPQRRKMFVNIWRVRLQMCDRIQRRDMHRSVVMGV